MSREFNLVRGVQGVSRGFEQVLRDLGGVRSEEMRASGRLLARSIRRVLGQSGGGAVVASVKTRRKRAIGGTPSAPGEPPRKQTGQLQRSVKAGPVGPRIRVGPLRFTAPILEEGVDTSKPARKTSAVRVGGRLRNRLRARSRHRRIRGGKLRIVIAARPFMARALAAVRDELGPLFVSEVRKRTPETT